MPYELGNALLHAQAVTETELARALFAVATEGVPLPRALVALGVMRHDRLEAELARTDAPVVRHVVPVPELVERLPPGLCGRLLAVPIRLDARTGTVDVAVADARDPHPPREIGFFLKAPVRVVRAPLAELEAALDRGASPAQVRAEALAPPIWVPSTPPRASMPPRPSAAPPRPSMTPIWGTPIPRKSTMPPPNRMPSLRPTGPMSVRPTLQLASSIPPPSTEAAPIPLLRRSDDLPRSDDPVFALAAPLDRVVSTVPYGFTGTDGVEVHAEGVPLLPFADPATLLADMRTAETRDAILDALLRGGLQVARKVGIFVLKKDAYVGHKCSPELGDETAFRRVEVPLGTPGPFTTAATGSYLGPLYTSVATEGLLAVMKRASGDVAIHAVRVQGRAVTLVVADDLGDTALSTRRLDELCRAASDGLLRILRRGR